MSLKGKVAIVTGSARALGRAFAVGFGREGARVVICDILDGGETASQVTAAGGEALYLRTDVTSEQSTLDMAKRVVERFGRIDVLVNNAAMQADLARKPFYEITPDEWDKVMAVNVKGMFLCCKAVFPQMKQQGSGKIINISSGTAFGGGYRTAHYVTSKGGVVSFTRAMAHELGEYNINVNSVAPGQVPTEAYRVTEERQRGVIARRCLKRAETPEDVVGAALFLASPASDFITGEVIVVDGGATMH